MNLETVIVRSSELNIIDLQAFVLSGSHADQHVVYVFDSESLDPAHSALLVQIAQAMNNQKLSFVLVSSALSYEDVFEGVALCPTLEEAHDLIELEAIQRDLEE
jgi:hypothetical protein